MAKDVDQILIGANGAMWIAPVGTVAPADETEAPGAGWVDIGHSSEDGVSFKIDKNIEVVDVWALFEHARRFVTSRDITASSVLRQWNKDTVVLAFGGGDVTTVTAGHFKYTPPPPEDLDERASLIDWADGTRNYRLVIPRVMVTEGLETKIARTDPADLPVTLGVLGTDGVDPFYLLTNDPAFG